MTLVDLNVGVLITTFNMLYNLFDLFIALQILYFVLFIVIFIKF